MEGLQKYLQTNKEQLLDEMILESPDFEHVCVERSKARKRLMTAIAKVEDSDLRKELINKAINYHLQHVNFDDVNTELAYYRGAKLGYNFASTTEKNIELS